MSTTDVLIVGGGPAGLAAALTLVRQNHPVIVFDTQKCRALSSLRLHGVTGSDGQPPEAVLAHTRKEVASYKDFTSVNAEIVEIKKIDSLFEAKDSAGNLYRGRRVILANGVKDCFPAIEGYAEAWGKAIFHNPFAQGYQNSTSLGHSGVLAVDWIAMPKFALHLTHLLLQLTPTVTIYTNGNPDLITAIEPQLKGFKKEDDISNVKIDDRTISRLAMSPQGAKDEVVIDLFFTDGTQTIEAFLGHAAMTKLNDHFAEQLSIDVSQSGAEYVVNGPTNVTGVKGIHAVGDAINMFKVWPNAVASGAVTAAGVAVSLQEEKWDLPPIFG